MKPKFQVNNLVGTEDLKRNFLKGDTSNLFNKLYETTEIINDTIASSRIDELQERYNEALLKRQSDQ